jgi:phosphoribosylcarboxyaminoimidazole (NCAIR) mutase
METAELPTMLAALLLMFASVGAKVGTSQLIGRMKHQINHVASIRQEALGRLKIVQSQNAVVMQNKTVLATKKAKLTKRLNRLQREMGTLEQDDEARKQRSEMRKVD